MFPIRDDQPRYSTPYFTYFLIGLNLIIFFFEWKLGRSSPRSLDKLIFQLGGVPNDLSVFLKQPSISVLPAIVFPLFTSMFLHGSWLHVIGNMWTLYIFGDNVEDYLGHFAYAVFYVLSGLLAMFTQYAINLHSTVPVVGASGAIAGILGAYIVLYPRARVLTWFFVFVFYVPAWLVLILWFVLPTFEGAASSLSYHGRAMGGIAEWAHVGGFIAGLLMIKLFPQRRRRYPYSA